MDIEAGTQTTYSIHLSNWFYLTAYVPCKVTKYFSRLRKFEFSFGLLGHII